MECPGTGQGDMVQHMDVHMAVILYMAGCRWRWCMGQGDKSLYKSDGHMAIQHHTVSHMKCLRPDMRHSFFVHGRHSTAWWSMWCRADRKPHCGSYVSQDDHMNGIVCRFQHIQVVGYHMG